MNETTNEKTRSQVRKENWQGMNWIRQTSRLAIYLRDGLSCAYCGFNVEDGARLTLDHVVAHELGGSNHPSNLVTCCARCNESKGKRSLLAFATATAHYLNRGMKAADIVLHVESCTARDIKKFRGEARTMVERRGSAAKALKNL